MSHVLVYVTASCAAEAEALAENVLNGGLAACANIFTPMRSLYWWQGRLEKSEEAVLLLKTAQDRFEPLRRRLRELHSYSTPCILALPVTAGDQDYLNWLEASLEKKS
jgi:periplasmic divalent cation tolerance protein